MAAKKKAAKKTGYDITKWQRSRPDTAIDALVETMSNDTFMSFNEIFDKFMPVFRTKQSAQIGEEAARLRCYEKLQNMVTAGKVEKIGKEYRLRQAPTPPPAD